MLSSSSNKHQKLFRERLQKLVLDCESYFASKNLIKKFFIPKILPKSLYIHGKVGRGKTMLMKEFYSLLKKTPKVYFHFNSFMQKIHEQLHEIRTSEKKYKDELIEAVKRIIKDKKVICFDEFQVLDIADAMLLSRIFSFIFASKIIVVFTSNSAPKDLYKNGLQREVFLEFVDKVLLKNCEIVEIQGDVDYRTLHKKNLFKRYLVSNQKNRVLVKEMIKKATNGKKLQPKTIKIWGHDLLLRKTYQKVAVVNFKDLCAENLAAADYRAICKDFDLIFLLKLPKLGDDHPNELRRFTLLIDEVYENKVALVILAQSKIANIFNGTKLPESLARTLSRLKEIKSDAYLLASKGSLLL